MVPSVLVPTSPDPSPALCPHGDSCPHLLCPCGDSQHFPSSRGRPRSSKSSPWAQPRSPLWGPPDGRVRGTGSQLWPIKSPAQSLPAVAHDSALGEGVGEACRKPQHHHVALPEIPDFLLLHVHIPDVIQQDHHCGWGSVRGPLLPNCPSRLCAGHGHSGATLQRTASQVCGHSTGLCRECHLGEEGHPAHPWSPWKACPCSHEQQHIRDGLRSVLPVFLLHLPPAVEKCLPSA